MKTISVADDIVPIAEFKTGISKWFRKLQESGHPLIITQNGKPSGVLLSPRDYDELVYRKSFLDSIDRGLSDLENERTYSSEELLSALASRRSEG